MNLNVLRYVEAVAQEHSFTKAAARLFVAQPSLSQAIRALEQDLGTELFDRGGRAVNLTPSGERYLLWAKTVLSGEKRLRDALAVPGGLRKLIVGATPHRCKALFPAAIEKFHRNMPDCKIDLHDQYQEDLMLQLDEGRLDLVVDLPPVAGYGTELVTQERILLAIPKRFKLTVTDVGGPYPVVQPEDLLAVPVVLIDDSKYATPLHLGRILRRLYAGADMTPDVAIQCCSAEMAHLLAAQGLGFTVISELIMRVVALPDLQYCELAGQTLNRDVCAIWSTTRNLSDDGAYFVHLLREQAERVCQMA